MFGILRFIRGFIGFVFIASVADLLNPLIKKANDSSLESSVTDSVWFDVFLTSSISENVIIGLVAIVVTGALFVFSRNLINSVHKKHKGEPHPSLSKFWSL